MGTPAAAGASPAPGSPLALVGTFAVTAFVLGVAAYVAARYVLGDVPVLRAFGVGAVTAAVVVALIRYPPAIVLGFGFAADAAAFSVAYRLRARTAAWVALVHFTLMLVLTLAVTWTLAVQQLAPG